MSGEAEPRRSVRATKGQHTKSFDELEPATVPKRRQTKKTKKAQELEQEHDQEEQDPDQGQDAEVIRCVCGATEQDEDSGEAWISCETCFAWQHNVCVGVSSYEDEIPENYWCEQCRPENHKELLEGIARGEKPWEARRKAHEEESKKKRKGGRRAKGKRTSDPKDELDKDGRAKAKASPTPEAAAREKNDSSAGPKQGKRKSREDSHDTDGKTPKLRRVSENEAVPVGPPYTPPEDLAKSITELPSTRVGPAKALKKSLTHILGALVKGGELEVQADSSVETMAETFALQIERAVLDTHPATKGQKEYGQQIKSLAFNLKNNPELCHGLVAGVHTPPTLAVMTSDQLASAELQRQTAEMKARAEKQSILYTGDTGPRVRRTHKGEEVVEDESGVGSADVPPPVQGGSGARRTVPQLQQSHSQHIKHESIDSPQRDGLAQHSPSNPNFDISKVFSSVKSSSPGAGAGLRRTSSAAPAGGPGIDPDVDRMLQDDGGGDDYDSPPYSPTEEAPPDPDVVWRGTLAMSSIADFQATAKHIGGANFAHHGPWSRLIPKRMTVAGRIPQQSAIEYLCSLRYSNLTDVVVVNITPVSPDKRDELNALIDYFVNKKRYGVIGDKVAANVRDTYLVPVPAGEDGHPEFMLNLVDNYLPKSRTEPMLLAVFVYRNEPEQLKQQQQQQQQQQQPKEAASSTAPAVQQTPVPIPLPAGAPQNANPPPLVTGPNAAAGAGYAQRSNSVSGGPAFSPATPQAPGFSPQSVSTTPVPIPQPPHTNRPPPTPTPPTASATQAQQWQGQAAPAASPPANTPVMSETQKFQAQAAGQKVAQEVLGTLIQVPTAQFLLPQAFQMSRREWEVIRGIYERDQRARDDLNYLGVLLEKQGAEARAFS